MVAGRCELLRAMLAAGCANQPGSWGGRPNKAARSAAEFRLPLRVLRCAGSARGGAVWWAPPSWWGGGAPRGWGAKSMTRAGAVWGW
ncbi:hypothetical protein, partial [Nocardia abscessus]|uniref:hypothetical protein n=1 Tax=Nocardia abscessus TaxID=120957 RepID=UPI0024539AB6